MLKSGGSFPTLLVGDFGLATSLPASAEGRGYPASPAKQFPSPPEETSSVVRRRIPAIRAPSLVGTPSYFPYVPSLVHELHPRMPISHLTDAYSLDVLDSSPEYLIAHKEQDDYRRRGKKRRPQLLDATKMDSWAVGVMTYIMATYVDILHLLSLIVGHLTMLDFLCP